MPERLTPTNKARINGEKDCSLHELETSDNGYLIRKMHSNYSVSLPYTFVGKVHTLHSIKQRQYNLSALNRTCFVVIRRSFVMRKGECAKLKP